MAELAGIVERLQAIAEELAEAGIDVLRAAVREGATKRPAEERKIGQARRAVERAVAALSSLDGDGSEDPDAAADEDDS